MMRVAVHRLAGWLVPAMLALLPPAAGAALPVTRWATSNGVPVYFVRTDALPILDVNLDFDAGSRLDPPGREGLASLTATLLDRGAGELDENGLDDAFARIGAREGSGAGTDRASVSMRTLTEPDKLDRAVALIASVIRAPRFDAEVLAREKARLIQGLKQAMTEPESIARRRFDALLYPGHPYGRDESPDSVAGIDVPMLRAFHAERYVAANATLTMVGAIDLEAAHRIAEQLVGGLAPGLPSPPVPTVSAPVIGTEVRIAHAATQSHILIGEPVMSRLDPDYFPLYVGNYILGGGGFVSRLYDEVRERRGLAYSIYSYFLPMRAAGPWMVGLQTRRSHTDEALAVVRDTIARFVAEGPTADELAAAKAHLSGGFALKLDSNAKIVSQLASVAFYRLPPDWLDTWTARVEAVSLAQVRDAFKRRLRLDRLQTVVVGDPGAPAAHAQPPGASR